MFSVDKVLQERNKKSPSFENGKFKKIIFSRKWKMFFFVLTITEEHLCSSEEPRRPLMHITKIILSSAFLLLQSKALGARIFKSLWGLGIDSKE
jgi:hypothetical protein